MPSAAHSRPTSRCSRADDADGFALYEERPIGELIERASVSIDRRAI
jgi:hypothetical protein